MADDGDQIALAPGLHAQDAEAVLVIMEGHALDEPGEDFRAAVGRLLDQHGMNAAVQLELTRLLGRVAKGENGLTGTVRGNQAWQRVGCRAAAVGRSSSSNSRWLEDHENRGAESVFVGRRHGRLGNGGRSGLGTVNKLVLFRMSQRFLIGGISFRRHDNFPHHFDRLHWVLALSCFPRQHDTVGTVVDGIGNIRNFGTRRTRRFGHAFEHLRRDNDGLAGRIASGHHFLLGIGHLLQRDFDAQLQKKNGIKRNKLVYTCCTLN